MTNKEILDTMPAPPKGFRYMTAHEAEGMEWGDPIRLMTPAGMEHALVRGFKDDAMTVVMRSGAVIVLDLDDPNYWPDARVGDRRPPLNVQDSIVAIRETGATADEDVEPLLRVSVAVSELMKHDEELQHAVARVREIVALRIRGIAA